MPVVEEIDLFLMANLSPRLTGLPFVVWISPRGNARHDIRIKVSPGPRAKPEEMISVAIRPMVRVIEADMPAEDFELLSRWVDLNRDVLIRYWDGDLAYTEEVLASLRAIGEAPETNEEKLRD
jgi:hypothetical protein